MSLSQLVNLGVHENLTDLDKRTIRLVNLICILSIGIGVLSLTYTMVFIGFVFWGLFAGFINTGKFMLVLWLNKKDKFNYSRILIVIFNNVTFFMVFLTLDYRIRPEVIFLSSFAVYAAMFNQLKTIIAVSLSSLFVIELGIYLQISGIVVPIINADDYNLLYVHFPQVAVAATIMLVITIFFKRTSEQYQLKLESTNKELERLLEINQVQKKELEKTLEENTFLFKEIHHRVKNNMQIVSGLLELQLNKVKDEQAKEALIQSSKRINAMSLVHQQLYQSDIVERVALQKFISELVDNIARISSTSGNEIQYNIKVDDITLDLDTAIPLGLIINELISNAYKHAFAKSSKSENIIDVSIQHQNGNLVMIVNDNGIGMDVHLVVDGSASLGLFLVDLLTGQLDGTISRQNKNGLMTTLTIPYNA